MKNKRFNPLSFLRAMLTLSLVLALTLSMAGCFEVVEDVSYRRGRSPDGSSRLLQRFAQRREQ